MAHLRNFNIIISYKTLERDLKQIKEQLGFDLEYKRNLGYKCENENFIQPLKTNIEPQNRKVGFENELFAIINVFEYKGDIYCNCLDKNTSKIFLMNYK